MSWIGLRDDSEGVFSPAGLGQPNLATLPDPDSLLTTGTLFVECSYEPGPLPVNILRLFSRDPWPSALTLCLDTDGTLRLLMRHGARHLSRDLATDLQVSESVLQITYAWDCSARRGTLTLYVPDRCMLFQTDVSAPFPLTFRDATRLMADRTLCKTDPSLRFAALSNRVEPAGPMPAIGAGATILTPRGKQQSTRCAPVNLSARRRAMWHRCGGLDRRFCQHAGGLHLACCARPIMVLRPILCLRTTNGFACQDRTLNTCSAKNV